MYTHKVKGNWNEGISRCERSVSGRQGGRMVAPDSADWRKANKKCTQERRELLCPAGLYVFPSCGGQHKLGFKVRVTKILAVVYPSSMKNSVRLVTRPWPVNIIGFFSGKTQ